MKREYIKKLATNKSPITLKKYITDKEKEGWEAVGDIQRAYDGTYQCLLRFKGRGK